MAIVVRDDALANLGCTPHTDVRTFWKKIAEVVSCAPDNVTLFRRIDVAVWIHAKGTGM